MPRSAFPDVLCSAIHVRGYFPGAELLGRSRIGVVPNVVSCNESVFSSVTLSNACDFWRGPDTDQQDSAAPAVRGRSGSSL